MAKAPDAMGHWQFNGGRARLAQCVAALEKGKSLVLFALSVDEARNALYEAVAESGALATISIEGKSNSEPLAHMLQEALDNKGRLSVAPTLRGLLNADELSDHLLLLSDPQDSSSWGRFLKLFDSERSRSSLGTRAPVLAIVAKRGARGFEAAQTFDDLGLAEPFDLASFVHERHLWGADLIGSTCSSVTVEVACGDFNLADDLVKQPAEVALDPTAWLNAQQPREHMTERWRGKLQPDSIWLARHDPAALRRRVWRGQMSVLMPYVEDVRAETIAHNRSLLRPGACDRETDELLQVEDYEWPELYRQFARSAASSRLLDLASEMRLLRNSLAHCKPVLMHEVRAAMRAHAAAR